MKTTSSRTGYVFCLPWYLTDLGGVNQAVQNLYNEVTREGKYQPLVLINDFSRSKPCITETSGRETICFQIKAPWGNRRPLRCLAAFLFSLPLTLARLYGIVKKYNISVINVHYPGLSALNFILLRIIFRRKQILILSFHGLDATAAVKSKGLERLVWRVILKGADRIILCSEALKDRLLALVPERADLMTTVHNGIDFMRSSIEIDREQFPSELENRRYILNVGTFEEKKGQDILIAAFRCVAAQEPDIALVLIGCTGELSEKIGQMVAMFGLQDRVFVYENVPHGKVLAVMEHAEMFVLPSRDEPFGIVLLEAALFSVPLIGARVGGVPEVVIDGKTGLLVGPEDVEELTRVMLCLLANKTERRRLGQAMHQRTIAKFSWQSAYQKYTSIINELEPAPSEG
jgi:glycosyltransferase involved in cell wall biosynthesis